MSSIRVRNRQAALRRAALDYLPSVEDEIAQGGRPDLYRWKLGALFVKSVSRHHRRDDDDWEPALRKEIERAREHEAEMNAAYPDGPEETNRRWPR